MTIIGVAKDAEIVMDTIPYQIRLRKGELEIAVQGDREWVENKFKELTTTDFTISMPKALTSGKLPETLGEFLDMKSNPKKHTDVVAIFAYWLFKKQKLASFNVKDIVACYDSTRRAKPKNPNMIVNANVSTHTFAEASEKKDGLKAWIITRSGEEYVEQMR